MIPLFLFPVLAVMLGACATPDPENLANTIEVQNEKMYEMAEKSRKRRESWDQRWDAYKDRQDQKYDAWLDKVFVD